MIVITDKTKCCGCTSCANICPQSCISMVSDEEGFLYPQVNNSECVNCGMCEKVCPVLNEIRGSKEVLESYVVRTRCEQDLEHSTSGGFVTPLIHYVLENGGVACAAGYSSENQVKHIFISEENDNLNRIRGSKYVQSELGDCFIQVRNYLLQGRKVLFIGTTCQIYGLKAFLRKDYDDLLCVDLVCHGVPSPKLWKEYIRFQEKKYGGKILRFNFRNKTYGYHSSSMRLDFDNGITYYGSARVDYMLKSFFSEICSRPICYTCPFKTIHRVSDFTIYDAWHAKELVSGLKDDDKGYTNLFVQTIKGKKLFEKIKESYVVYQTATEQAITLDGVMINNPAKPHTHRPDFYSVVFKDGIERAVCKYIPVTKKDIAIEKIKGIIYRAGLFNLLKGLLKV